MRRETKRHLKLRVEKLEHRNLLSEILPKPVRSPSQQVAGTAAPEPLQNYRQFPGFFGG
jgi:hypothetical protein